MLLTAHSIPNVLMPEIYKKAVVLYYRKDYHAMRRKIKQTINSHNSSHNST